MSHLLKWWVWAKRLKNNNYLKLIRWKRMVVVVEGDIVKNVKIGKNPKSRNIDNLPRGRYVSCTRQIDWKRTLGREKLCQGYAWLLAPRTALLY